MQIRHIAILPNDAILWHGAIAIEIVLGGMLEASVLEVVQLIDTNIRDACLKAPLVIIDGRVPDLRDPDDVLELIQVLVKKGITVLGKTSGNVHPRWLNECNKVQVSVTNEPWLGYKCDELLYNPPVNEPMIEPNPMAASTALKNLYVGTKIAPAVIFSFLQTSAFNWQITTDPKIQYAVVVVKDGKN
jgi:hypothetical protein